MAPSRAYGQTLLCVMFIHMSTFSKKCFVNPLEVFDVAIINLKSNETERTPVLTRLKTLPHRSFYVHHYVMYDSYLLKDVHSVLVNFPREYGRKV